MRRRLIWIGVGTLLVTAGGLAVWAHVLNAPVEQLSPEALQVLKIREKFVGEERVAELQLLLQDARAGSAEKDAELRRLARLTRQVTGRMELAEAALMQVHVGPPIVIEQEPSVELVQSRPRYRVTRVELGGDCSTEIVQLPEGNEMARVFLTVQAEIEDSLGQQWQANRPRTLVEDVVFKRADPPDCPEAKRWSLWADGGWGRGPIAHARLQGRRWAFWAGGELDLSPGRSLFCDPYECSGSEESRWTWQYGASRRF